MMLPEVSMAGRHILKLLYLQVTCPAAAMDAFA